MDTVMANVLTMTPNPNESNEDFAARVSEQATEHFGGTDTAPESAPEPAATDDSAEPTEAVPPA